MEKVFIEKKELEDNIFLKDSKIFLKKNCVCLDEKKAKRIYFLCKCSFKNINSKSFYEWVTSNFSRYSLCKWNNEYLNIKITKLENILKHKKIKSFDNIRFLINDCFVYSNDENLFERFVLILEKIANQIGFRNLFCNETFYDCETKIIEKMLCSMYKKSSRHLAERGNLHFKCINEYYKNDLCISEFFPNAKYCGILANIGYCGFKEIFRKYVEKLLIPFINSFSDCNTSVDAFLGYEYFLYIKKFLLEFDDKVARFFEDEIFDLIKNCPANIKSGKEFVFQLKVEREKKCYSVGVLHLQKNIFVTDSILFCKEKLKVGFFGSSSVLDYSIIYKNKSLGICFFKIKSDWHLPIFTPNISLEICCNKLLIVKGSKAFYNKHKRGWINDLWDFYFSASYGKIVKRSDTSIIVNITFPTKIYGAWAYDLDGVLVGLVKPSKKIGDSVKIIPVQLIFNLLKKITIEDNTK